MQTIGIRDLQINPAMLTKALEQNEYTIITKRSNPIGIALSFNDDVMTYGLKTSFLIDGYKTGAISLGQLSSSLDISKEKAMKMLSLMGIDVISYDFSDDMKNMDSFL